MSAMPHSKFQIPLQQSIAATATQLVPPTIANCLAFGVPMNNAIVPRAENIFVQNISASATMTISNSSVVASGGAGYSLSPGQGMNLPLKNISAWYAVSTVAAQPLEINFQYGLE